MPVSNAEHEPPEAGPSRAPEQVASPRQTQVATGNQRTNGKRKSRTPTRTHAASSADGRSNGAVGEDAVDANPSLPSSETSAKEGARSANGTTGKRYARDVLARDVRSLSSPQHVATHANEARSSPLHYSTSSSTPLPSGAVMGSGSDRHASTPPLDAAEREQFHFEATASPSSRILAHPPPALPYDLSYPPLSPMGTDQAGHSIALRHGSSLASGSKDGRAIGAGSHGARGSLQAGHGSDRPKKTLAGEELEAHLVSEASSQDAMPWGLKSTLLEKSQQLPRGRTRMGSLKRNAPRSVRSRHGVEERTQTPQPIKLEDEGASEMSSPAFPTVELEGAQEEGDTASANDGELFHNEDSEQPRDAMDLDSHQRVIIETGSLSHGAPVVSSPLDSSKTSRRGTRLSVGRSNGARPGQNGQQSARYSATRQHVDEQDLDDEMRESRALSDAGTEADASNMEDASNESNHDGPTRRPRAAHKRLKLMGGYYGKGAKQPPAAEESVPGEETPAPNMAAEGMVSSQGSRAGSEMISEDVGASGLQNGVTIATEAIAGPSTPVKPSQQPSLAMGLRESATKRQSTKLHHAGTRNDDDDDNNPFCDTCNGIGHFICCDGCPRSFHFACINPPLDIDELPSTFNDEDDQWFCNVCRAQSKPSKGKRPKGVWGPLLQNVEDENPTIFSLPQDIRNYFRGVATATDGSYIDSSMLKPLKVNKLGIVDERDPLRLKDKNGKFVLCYRCGQSALPPLQDNGRQRETMAQADQDTLSEMNRSSWRRLVGCDFCSLYWHLDCLDPPLATMPSLTRKWMCPNHVEHVLRPERVPKNAANSLSVHDLPLPSERSVGSGKHYRTRVVNDGRIDIIPDPMDTYFGGSGSLGSQDADGHIAPASAVAGSSGSENRGRGLDRGWDEVDIPGAHAKVSNGNASSIRFKYRLPEKVIRVDFWSRAELERKQAIQELANLEKAKSQAQLDLLATIAGAELQAENVAEDIGKSKADQIALSSERVRTLVAEAFGSGAVFARPAKAIQSDRSECREVIAPDVEASTISALRDTFKEGEFEREFAETEPLPPVRTQQKRPAAGRKEAASEGDAAVASDAATEDPLRGNAAAKQQTGAVTADDDSVEIASSSAEHNETKKASVSSLEIDADELAQLRALRRLVQYRGADALLGFVLEGQSSSS